MPDESLINNCVLSVIAKQPVVGQVKTRLVPPLSPSQAALLSEAMLRDTLNNVSTLRDINIAVSFSPGTAADYFSSITSNKTLLIPDDFENLGDCLPNTIHQLLALNYRKVILLNSDSPTLPLAYISQAFSELDSADIILGPSEDGGYYLIGMKRLITDVFHGIPWSTKDVLESTVEKASRLGLKVSFTPLWYDIDSIDDLIQLRNEISNHPSDKIPHTRKALNTIAESGALD